MLDQHSSVPSLDLCLDKTGELAQLQTPGRGYVLEQGLQSPLLSMEICHLELQVQLMYLIYIYLL